MKPIARQFEIRLKFNETQTLVRRKHNELVNAKKVKENRLMPCKLLKSSKLQETKLKYGVCFLSKGKKALDVVPIERVFDFETDFTYLDGVEAGNTSDKESASTIEPSPSELHNFPLRYESNFEHSPWSQAIRERTTKEPWKLIELVDKETKCFGKKKIRFSDQLEEAKDGRTEKKADQCYGLRRIEKPNNNGVLPKKTLQLAEKINRILINCGVIPFGKLVSLLDSDLEQEVIVKKLQQSAMLVQGCWVIKSELLYANNQIGKQNELAIIWDFVSFLFTESRQLKLKDIIDQIRFPSDLLLNALSRLATFDRTTHSWEFLYQTDTEFLASLSSTIRQQMEVAWQIRRLQIYKNLSQQIEKFREKSRRVKPIAAAAAAAVIKKIELDKPIKKRLRKKRVKI